MDESTPPSHIDTHTDTCRGSRVAATFNSAPLINSKPKQIFSSFKNPILSISDPIMKTPIMFVIIYRAPGPYTEFLSEFPEFISALVLNTDEVIIVCVFKIDVTLKTTALVQHFSHS